MTVADPHAIPESTEQCVEYATEAASAWTDGDTDRAYELYHALVQSSSATQEDHDVGNHRLGLIAQQRGEVDAAYVFLRASHDPGAADSLQLLLNSTHDKQAPDPDGVPASTEECHAWFDAARAAEDAGDLTRALGLFAAVARFTDQPPEYLGYSAFNAGRVAAALGDADTARQWFEYALTLFADPKDVADAQHQLQLLGTSAPIPADASEAEKQVITGVAAYEGGAAGPAREALEAALHLDGPAEVKNRAHYYLGAMDYQDHRYAEARNHVEAAAAGAPEPEKSWAHAMLAWRWDE